LKPAPKNALSGRWPSTTPNWRRGTRRRRRAARSRAAEPPAPPLDEDTKGFNPYKFGFGAASDSHNTGVPYRQDNFYGGHAALDGTIEKRMSGTLFSGADPRPRESIFNAMKRKETFAVSGPHIKVRFFGGWNYANTATIEQRREFWNQGPRMGPHAD
jgi:Protein of unknown function (DUF3604)